MRKRPTPLLHVLILAFGMASASTAFACPKDCDPEALAKTPWNIARARFEAALAAGDSAAADAAADEAIRILGEEGIQLSTDLLVHRVFASGQCDIDALLAKQAWRDPSVVEGALVCAAARLPVDDEASSRALLAKLLDARVESNTWHGEVFDLFARQLEPSRKALAWMVRHGLDDRSFESSGEDALIAQVRAGRADNVALLLGLGYDPNAAHAAFVVPGRHATHVAIEPAIPLQAAREALADRGERALEVARVLLAHGADPRKLRWHVPRNTTPAEASLVAAFDALLAQAAAAREPLTTEFAGLLVEMTEQGERVYARFTLRNAGDKPLRVSAWKDGDAFLLGQLNWESHLQDRQAGGDQWNKPVSIEHGLSPGTALVVPAGGSGEIRYQLSLVFLLEADPHAQHRLWFRDAAGGEHFSEPFSLRDPVRPTTSEYREKPRKWLPPGW